MRLKEFRIVGCFGFSDSREVDLDPPGGVVLLLGRNSSGKTTFLQALSHLEVDSIPSNHKNFYNFNPDGTTSRLMARFSVQAEDVDVSEFIERIKKKLERMQIPAAAFTSFPPLTKLLTVIEAQYVSLFESALLSGEIWVERFAGGGYRFLVNPRDLSQSNGRSSAVSRALAEIGGRVRYDKIDVAISLTSEQVENELFYIFPSIKFFSSSYRMGDDISDRIEEVNLASPGNPVEAAFISFLGKDSLKRMMMVNDPDEREEILIKLRGRAALLCERINRQLSSWQPASGLVDIILHENRGVQVTVKVDGKKSFYRHLSDNTKILIAYHLHSLVEDIKYGVFLFDEPSTGFHPTAQGFLLEFLQSLARSGAQVILSSHSEYMIDLDALNGVRLMSKDSKGMLAVRNHPYRPAASKGDLLGLQPLLDAIGLRYGLGITMAREMVLVEGVTDLLYLRAMNRHLGVAENLAIAPARGDSNILTLIPFFVGQGIGFKILLDAGGLRKKIQDSYGLADEFIFEVPAVGKSKSSGIEDLFSRNDFLRLVDRFGIEIGEKSVDHLSNSALVRGHPGKTVLAHRLLGTTELDLEFDDETTSNFRAALEFCSRPTWFLL